MQTPMRGSWLVIGNPKSVIFTAYASGCDQHHLQKTALVWLLTGGAVSDYGVVGLCYSGGRIRLIVNVLAICLTSPADRRGACGLIFPGVLLWKPMLRTVYFPAAG